MDDQYIEKTELIYLWSMNIKRKQSLYIFIEYEYIEKTEFIFS